jgi:tripartite-type tricarboxylate transporter receptor subunit TctC
MIESGLKDFVIEGKFGFVAPAGTPPDIVAKINAGIVRALRSPDVKQRFQQLGYEVIGDTPEEYRATLKADTELYGRIVKKLGIKGGN